MHVSAHVGWFNSEAMNQSEEKKTSPAAPCVGVQPSFARISIAAFLAGED